MRCVLQFIDAISGGFTMAKLRLGFCGTVAMLGAVCLPIAAAHAAPITATYDFTYTFGTGAPFNPWNGSFTLTFDPTATGTLGPLALDAFSSNLPASYGTFEFLQNSSDFTSNNIEIGDDCSASTCDNNPGFPFMDLANFSFLVNSSGVPTSVSAVITSTFTFALFITSPGSVTLVSETPATPLPATLPLFATGLGALGLLGWFGKRKARVSLLGAE
jgi:hypothetical protein